MRICTLSLLSAVLLALALPAAALPGISLSDPPAATGPSECALLMQIKYPWLECATGADGVKRVLGGNIAANASWEDDRWISRADEWVEGYGAWLPISNDE